MSAACRVLGLNRSSVLRRRAALVDPSPKRRSRKQTLQPRALSPLERDEVKDLLHSERYRNQTPAEIVEKVLYLRRNYHLGPIRIVWYLARYHGTVTHGIKVSQD